MVVKDYKSWYEYRDDLDKIPKEASTGSEGYWSGDAGSIGAALAIADTGWPKGAERINKIALPVVKAMSGSLEQESIGWDVTGAAFDVGAYLSGVPEHWITFDAPDVRPAFTILANITSSGGIPARALEMRGAAVVALAMALQSSGYAVRVHACVGMACSLNGEWEGNDRNTVWQRVCLTDDAGGPMDTDRMLFALAHPAAPRQLMYGNGERLLGQEVHENHHLPWPKGGNNARPPEEWHSDLYLHAVYLDDAAWQDEESVSAWVKSQYDALTGGGHKQAKEE